MMICGVLIFARAAVARARCAKVIDERFLRVPALPPAPGRRRRRCRSGRPTPHFDLDASRRSHGAAGPRGHARAAGAGVAARRDAARSRAAACGSSTWSTTTTAAARSIARIHHCYADGIALVRVMLSMTDARRDGPPAMPFEPRERSKRRSRRSARAAAGAARGRARRRRARSARRWSKRAPRSGTIPRKAVALAEQGHAR